MDCKSFVEFIFALSCLKNVVQREYEYASSAPCSSGLHFLVLWTTNGGQSEIGHFRD
jgi:hypothetical protein